MKPPLSLNRSPKKFSIRSRAVETKTRIKILEQRPKGSDLAAKEIASTKPRPTLFDKVKIPATLSMAPAKGDPKKQEISSIKSSEPTGFKATWTQPSLKPRLPEFGVPKKVSKQIHDVESKISDKLLANNRIETHDNLPVSSMSKSSVKPSPTPSTPPGAKLEVSSRTNKDTDPLQEQKPKISKGSNDLWSSKKQNETVESKTIHQLRVYNDRDTSLQE